MKAGLWLHEEPIGTDAAVASSKAPDSDELQDNLAKAEFSESSETKNLKNVKLSYAMQTLAVWEPTGEYVLIEQYLPDYVKPSEVRLMRMHDATLPENARRPLEGTRSLGMLSKPPSSGLGSLLLGSGSGAQIMLTRPQVRIAGFAISELSGPKLGIEFETAIEGARRKRLSAALAQFFAFQEWAWKKHRIVVEDPQGLHWIDPDCLRGGRESAEGGDKSRRPEVRLSDPKLIMAFPERRAWNLRGM